MKTVIKLMFLMAGICFLMACTKSDDTLLIDDPAGSDLKSEKIKTVTVPFKADFLGTYNMDKIIWVDPTCPLEDDEGNE
jgi:hypothetical protein